MTRRTFAAAPALLFVSAALVAVSGCGVGSEAVVSQAAAMNIAGKLHGGVNPIISAKATLWATQFGNVTAGSTVTAPPAVALGTSTTDSNGAFSFSSVTCSTQTTGAAVSQTQYYYITATGGYTSAAGNSSVNNNSVLFTAIGDCRNFSSQTAQHSAQIDISEVSTVAGAYALGHFMTVSTTANGAQTVNIAALDNNNQVSGSCSGSGSAMTCQAAGLGHAFATAMNMVNSVTTDGTNPTGQAYITLPTNSDAYVPTALLNLLGNILQACVNSAGATGGTTNCDRLFADVPQLPVAGPTNTLQAMINLAKFPKFSSSTAANDFYTLASPNSFFYPALATAPSGNDYTVAIIYRGVVIGSTTTPFGNPNGLTLDANDNAYVTVTDSATYSNLAGLTYNGASRFLGTNSTKYALPGAVAADNLNNVWMSNNASQGSGNAAMRAFSTSTGAITQTIDVTTQSLPRPVAVDRSNNVWFGRDSSSAANSVFYLDPTSSYAVGLSVAGASQAVRGLAIDGNQDVWVAYYTSSTSGKDLAGVVANQNLTTPSYSSSAPYTSAEFSYSGVGVAVDSSNNGWFAYRQGVDKKTPALTSGIVTGISAASSAATFTDTLSQPLAAEFDGAGSFWTASSAGTILFNTTQASGANNYLSPCSAPGAASTCDANAPTTGASALQIDSAGNVWVAAAGTTGSSPVNGNVVEIIGTATPAWPLLSYGHPGVSPQ